MISVKENVSLQASNTLALPARARYYLEISSREQIPEAVAYAKAKQLELLVLGGGSNIVLTADFPGLVLKIMLRGIRAIELTEKADEEPADTVVVTACAGESWHQLVEYCLQRGYNGLENLALIPGTVGAAAIQNIGAYGVELTDFFYSLTGWDCEQQCWRSFTKDDCDFSYRNSIFKHTLSGRFVVVELSLQLHKTTQVKCGYGALQQQLQLQGITDPDPLQVAAAVIAVRQDKLPDPAMLANAGSFFKNPLLSEEQASQLKRIHPQLVCYPQTDGRVKLAAGWLLEQAGWKGKRLGPVGMHSKQSLVLVNYAGASGADVLTLVRAIQQDIQQQFNIDLEIEPVIY